MASSEAMALAVQAAAEREQKHIELIGKKERGRQQQQQQKAQTIQLYTVSSCTDCAGIDLDGLSTVCIGGPWNWKAGSRSESQGHSAQKVESRKPLRKPDPQKMGSRRAGKPAGARDRGRDRDRFARVRG
jgi:hypothetical protein